MDFVDIEARLQSNKIENSIGLSRFNVEIGGNNVILLENK